MSAETIISLILTIAFIIISVAAKNKGKKTAQAQPAIPENYKSKGESLNDFESLLKKLELRKKQQVTESKDDMHSVEYEEVKPIEHHKDNYDIVEEEENDFDLKSAIIYNAILERKKI